jgi:glycosyltransferase involved in cell wall biosynthesis
LNPVRVLMFARYLPPEYSGAATQAFLLADRLRERGHHVEFATQSWSGAQCSYEVQGFPVTALHMRPLAKHQEFSVWRSLALHLWRRRHHVDILHGHGAYYAQSILGPLGRLIGKPTLVKASMSQNDLSSLTHCTIAPIHRRFLGLVDAYVAISRDLSAEFADKGLSPERIWHIPNGVDTLHFYPVDETRRLQLAVKLGLPAGRRIALFVGVFDDRKRIEWLVQQWVESKGFGSGMHLVAVGPTSRDVCDVHLKQELRDYAVRHPNLVSIRNYTSNIRDFYQAANVLVFPSLKEGLPNTVLEAMACGLPCIVARAPGSRELITDGINGATFAIDHRDELAAALVQVTDEEVSMGKQSRQIVLKQYDIEGITDQYEALYQSLISSRREND